MAAKKPSPKQQPARVYKLKVALSGPKPPIWRGIQVPDCTLDLLDGLLQAAMGWEGCHLSQFELGKRVLGDPESLEDDSGKVEDWSAVSLASLMPAAGKTAKLVYTYDFGDDWRHEVVLEGSAAPVEGVDYPVCTGGARACPPEDVGGEPGYEELLEVLAGPKNKRYKEMIEWLEEPFDPEAFSIDEASLRLRKWWRAMTGR